MFNFPFSSMLLCLFSLSALILNPIKLYCAVSWSPHHPNMVTAPLIAHVCHEKKFVWFGNAKVGSSTMELTFINNNLTLLRLFPYYSTFRADEYEDYFKFGFVRNPWDRIVSVYHDKVINYCYPPFKECHGKGFEYFVKWIELCFTSCCMVDPHLMLQTIAVPLEHVDFIGRFENYEEDFQYILNGIGLHNIEIIKWNSTDHGHYSEYYTEETKNIIAEIYKVDIEAFGYEFETISKIPDAESTQTDADLTQNDAESTQTDVDSQANTDIVES